MRYDGRAGRRMDVGYKEFRKAVLRRDKHKCQMPGCDRKRGLIVHHIQTYAHAATLRVDPDNGITLCKGCHYLIRKQEVHYAPLFLSIVGENK